MKTRFWRAVHNIVAHPLLETGTQWAVRFHDWTAEKAGFDDNSAEIRRMQNAIYSAAVAAYIEPRVRNGNPTWALEYLRMEAKLAAERYYKDIKEEEEAK